MTSPLPTSIEWFFDLDGVLADFDQRLSAIWPARPPVHTNQRSEKLPEDVRRIKAAAYDQIAMDDGFYAKLPWCAGGQLLWNAARVSGCPTGVLSAVPSFRHIEDPARRVALVERSIREKQDWVRTELRLTLPDPRVIIVRRSEDKVLHLPPVPVRGVLIDDRLENVQQWRDAGGTAIYHQQVMRTLLEMQDLLGI